MIASPPSPSSQRPSLVPAMRQKLANPNQRVRLSRSTAIPSMYSTFQTFLLCCACSSSSMPVVLTLLTGPFSAHMVPTGRTNWITMGQKTKSWIKGSRVAQLVLRIFEEIANIGLLILMILINNVESLTGWVLRTIVSPVPNRLPSAMLTPHSFADFRRHSPLHLWYPPQPQASKWPHSGLLVGLPCVRWCH